MPHELDDILHGDLHPFRRISRSILEMAFLTGVAVRVLHAVLSARGETLDWSVFIGRFVLIPIIALAMVAVHLSNYPVRQWLWRAPLFALIESATGAITSLALISIGRERWGTGRAELSDWPYIAGDILLWHTLIISLFALVLGAVVQGVRRRELLAERKLHLHAHPETHPEHPLRESLRESQPELQPAPQPVEAPHRRHDDPQAS